VKIMYIKTFVHSSLQCQWCFLKYITSVVSVGISDEYSSLMAHALYSLTSQLWQFIFLLWSFTIYWLQRPACDFKCSSL